MQFGDGLGAAIPAQALHTAGNGAGGDEHDFFFVALELGDLFGPGVDGLKVQALAVIGDQSAANLDHQAFGLGDAGSGGHGAFLFVLEQHGEGGGRTRVPLNRPHLPRLG